MATEANAIDKNIIKKVAQSAGWMQFKAKRELAAAQQLGITPKQYLRRKCWELDPQELKDLGERIQKQRRLREEQAAELSEATGWSAAESARRIRDAKKCGLTFKQYMKRRAYEVSEDDLPRLVTVYDASKRKRADNRAFMLDKIIEKSGWSREYAIEKVAEAKDLGINIFNFFSNSCWAMNEEELEACSQMCKGFHESASGKKEKCLDRIMEETGWSEGETAFRTLEASVDSGCSVEDYARCRMWELEPDQQRTFLNSTIFRKFRMAYNDFQVGSKIFDYKDVFEEVFSDLISRRHFTFEGLGKGEFIDKIRGLKHIVVKPARGSYGRDIEILPCNESYLQNGELYERLSKIDKPIVIEEKIEQCDILSELAPASVNTLRIVTLRLDGKTHILQCVLRCGVGAQVDNIHSGGLVIEVDPNSGKCLGDAVDYFGNRLKRHPITGVVIKGMVVPNIDEAITLAAEASKVVPECALIGWDIAVTEDGADLVEGNLKADYDAGQMAHLGVAHEGLRDSMVAPYVDKSALGRSYLSDIAKEREDAEAIDEAARKFTVVMPIYNGEDYIRDSIDSIIGQTIGFVENIQLVLVNDGSTDGTLAICEEYKESYPSNIVVVDKANGGPSSARNAGLEHAEGAFINFFDSDDKWAKDAFEKAWGLISQNKGKIDVAAGRMKFFEGKSGYHQLDYKFKEGDRIIDINEAPDHIQMSASSAFIAASALKERRFDERISIGEDAKLLVEVILDKGRYGILKSALYHCRKRDEGSSLTQTKQENKSSFIDTMRHYYSFIADYSVDKFGRVIPYVQHCLINGLKYRAAKPLPEILDIEERKEYRDRIISLLRQVDDAAILEAKNASASVRLYMLHLKTGAPLKEIAEFSDGEAWVNGGRAFKLTGNGDVRLEEIALVEDALTIKGKARIPGIVSSYGLFYEVGDSIKEISLDGEPVEEKAGITDEAFSRSVPIEFEVAPSIGGFSMRFYASYDEDVICTPIYIESDGPLAELKGGEISRGAYTISRPERRTLKFAKAESGEA